MIAASEGREALEPQIRDFQHPETDGKKAYLTLNTQSQEQDAILTWRTHLLRQEPRRLPVLLLTFALGASCVWMMFMALPPVLAALGLMTLAVSEYLLPSRYRLDATGATAEGGAGKCKIAWRETRRVVELKNGILLSPLPAPSRLDAFRGVLLRCAPDHQPGNRAEILAFAAKYAPNPAEKDTGNKNEHSKKEIPA